MEGIVETEEGEELGVPEENPLEGYTISSFKFALKDESTQEVFSTCTVTGPSEDEISIMVG